MLHLTAITVYNQLHCPINAPDVKNGIAKTIVFQKNTTVPERREKRKKSLDALNLKEKKRKRK